MRGSLVTHPKVIQITKILANDPDVGQRLSPGYSGCLDEIVSRDVTRDVTIASLLRVWCACNEHTSDGVWSGIEIDDLDQIAGVPGFGSAMEFVGWAIPDHENSTITFPNFLEYNAPAKNGGRSSGAERQRKYRERKKQEALKAKGRDTNSDGDSDVTRDVTSVTREEKRREEYKTSSSTGDGREKFSMVADWQPSEGINARMTMAGIPAGDLAQETLGEFKSYWLTRSDQLTQSQWEHKLIQALQSRRRNNHAAGSPSGNGISKRDEVRAAIRDQSDDSWAEGL